MKQKKKNKTKKKWRQWTREVDVCGELGLLGAAEEEDCIKCKRVTKKGRTEEEQKRTRVTVKREVICWVCLEVHL